MGFLNRRLMKWREPKIRGMVTPKNILTAVILVLVISIPFGYLGGNGKFNTSIWLLSLAFLSTAPLGLLLLPLEPGTLVQLRDDMIVRGPRGSYSDRSPYKFIDFIYYTRNCTSLKTENALHEREAVGTPFTNFQVVHRIESFNPVRRFAVPDNVNLEQVLQILRDKGVRVIETPFDATHLQDKSSGNLQAL